jgi:exonuclease III
VKLITLNIEGDRHLERVVPFIERENPDVVCLQEVFVDTLKEFTARGYTHVFLPMTEKLHNGVPTPWGVAICARGSLCDIYSMYYRDVTFAEDDAYWKALQEKGVTKNGFKNGVIGACAEIDGIEYVVSTTHFTWTENGETPSQEQVSSMRALLSYTTKRGSHLLCGDFNIPRNINSLFEDLVTAYTDNVPTRYVSSLDKDLHRLKDNPDKKHVLESFMVDYVFSQSPYRVSDARLEFNLSDHAAVVAIITKT